MVLARNICRRPVVLCSARKNLAQSVCQCSEELDIRCFNCYSSNVLVLHGEKPPLDCSTLGKPAVRKHAALLISVIVEIRMIKHLLVKTDYARASAIFKGMRDGISKPV